MKDLSSCRIYVLGGYPI